MLLTVLFIAVSLLFYLLYKKKLNYWSKRGVPNLKPITPLGDLIKCVLRKKNINVLLKDLVVDFKSKGHKFYGFYLTLYPIFVPIDYELIKKILIDDCEYFPLDTTLNVGASIQNEALLKHYLYNQEQADRNAKSLTEVIRKREDKPIDVLDLALCYVCDIAFGCYFGVEENNLLNETSSTLLFCTDLTQVKLINLLKLCLRNGIKNPVRLKKLSAIGQDANNFLLDFCKNLYNTRKGLTTGANDLFEVLMENTQVKEDEEMDFSLINKQLLMVFLETLPSANSLAYCLYQAGKMQDCQKKLRNEIFEATNNNNNQITADAIDRLDYLDRFFIETNRLHLLEPTLYRCCTKDYHMQETEVVIEKGTPLAISVYAICHDPERFSNPELFDPDRFLDYNQKQFMKNLGIEQQYSLGKILVKNALAQILLNYDIDINYDLTGKQLEEVFINKKVTSLYKNTFWLKFSELKSSNC